MSSNRKSVQNICIDTSKNGGHKSFRILALVSFKRNGSEVCIHGFHRATTWVLYASQSLQRENDDAPGVSQCPTEPGVDVSYRRS